ncbi:metal ABC transporter substrate-binding protein [Vallicoccus soli]|uniref:Zinc ABC transporter substrate-binding protein n=1 Tax=Vallicoccus soli TaxID=2339232 RepID=A0A3A3YWQ1_9ACTN|nr:metal ABC transporter substrate-binding protein [Vallicoccus soli]RJK96038.1 zinc ABC transporter substrate-binding protein [Vallicoccus soli]
MPTAATTARCCAAACCAALAVAGCAGPGGGGAAADGDVEVVASSYVLGWLVGEVGGERVAVQALGSPGADSHAVELTPQQVGRLAEVDLVVHQDALSPAADEAVATHGGDHVLEVSDGAELLASPGRAGDGEAGGEDGDGGAGVRDPHFWLDPTRLAAVAGAVADRLGEVDPAGAASYAEGAHRVEEELAALDAAYEDGLAACRGRTLVTSHEAFGYLAERYGLVQVGIAGLDPEVEPPPSRLRDVVEVVEGRDVRTVFFEVSTGPGLTRALAGDLGLRTGVLDPVERRPDGGGDYLSTMRDNLAALQQGLGCA